MLTTIVSIMRVCSKLKEAICSKLKEAICSKFKEAICSKFKEASCSRRNGKCTDDSVYGIR